MTRTQDGSIEKPCSCWRFDKRMAAYGFSSAAGKATWFDASVLSFVKTATQRINVFSSSSTTCSTRNETVGLHGGSGLTQAITASRE